jgi:hypothetical protein
MVMMITNFFDAKIFNRFSRGIMWFLLLPAAALAGETGSMMGHHGKKAMHGHAGAMTEQHGTMHQHDMVMMPGLQGKDTVPQEVDDLKMIFRSHQGITRSVENLPNGIRTVTEAKDSKLRDAIISHVSMMVTRLQEGRNPEVRIQSPTLDLLFQHYESVDTDIDMTPLGIAVTQTSQDPVVVGLLQQHAAEVSDMAARGMAAVHERMAGSGKMAH